jgi:UDP-N-acetylmuramoylalanine--D-glutamate ligase
VRFSELDGAAVGVWGAGREVASFASQLKRRLPAARIVVAAFDGAPPEDVAERLCTPDVRTVSADGAAEALAACDVVVRSPGVSIHRPELERIRASGTPVTTATALWLAERGGERVLGVTGTKGKSTTAALACYLARAGGTRARLAGNIGVPALDLLDGERGELDVVELSSYHTADLEVGPEVALVTNVYREHLDWHGSEEAYRAEKLRVLTLPGVHRCVLNARDPSLASLVPSVEVRRFGAPEGWDVREGTVTHAGRVVVDTGELPLPGEHNALNLCAALTGLEACGVLAPAPDALSASLADFAPLPHRLQPVADAAGVRWVDDSISTTPESAIAALASFPGRKLVLIGGGQDRGQDYGALAATLADRRAAVVGVPSTGERLVAAARAAGVERALLADDLEQAVALARKLLSGSGSGSSSGGVVLLSPAAPSYDSYRNFEQRGELFAALAQKHKGPPPSE